MSMKVQVLGRIFGQRLFHEHDMASIWSKTFMNMVVRLFGQRLFY